MTQASQLTGQGPGRFERPTQRRHRVTTAVGLDQGVQHHQQAPGPDPPCASDQPLAGAPGPAAPPANSFAPAISVLRLIPDASATRACPPRPNTSTIDAPSSLRWRSSKNGAVNEKNRDRPSSPNLYTPYTTTARLTNACGTLRPL